MEKDRIIDELFVLKESWKSNYIKINDLLSKVSSFDQIIHDKYTLMELKNEMTMAKGLLNEYEKGCRSMLDTMYDLSVEKNKVIRKLHSEIQAERATADLLRIENLQLKEALFKGNSLMREFLESEQ